MSRLGHHIRFRLGDDSAIASTIEERRVLARTVLEYGRRFDLYAFGYPDTHVHLAARVDRAGAGRLAHAIEVSLKSRLALTVGFVQYPPRALVDNSHLYNTVKYVLRQVDRHAIEGDPYREGSTIPDLLGLRTVGAYTVENLRRWLPRLRQHDYLELLGVTDLAPSDGRVEDVIPAALAAACLTSIEGSKREVVALRRAIIEVIGERLHTVDVAALLGCSRREVERRRAKPFDAKLVQAIRLQLGLREVRKDLAG